MRRHIGVVDPKGPPQAAAQMTKLPAVCFHLFMVGAAQAFHLANREFQGARDLGKFLAALIGQRFFCRIKHLNNVALNVAACQLAEPSD